MKTYLESARLKLRAPEPEDLEYYYRWENDTALWSSGEAHQPYSRYELKQFIASEAAKDFYAFKQMRFTVEEKQSGKPVGALDLFDFSPFHRRAAVGALIDTASQKRGYAAEALSLLLDYALNYLRLHQIYAYAPEDNEPSIRMLERCGFRRQGLLKDWLQAEDGYRNVYILSIIAVSVEAQEDKHEDSGG